ncbi:MULTISPECIES: diacylglycerol kinase family protein [Prochlorococcus]|uniref:diacylglycerol kinase family protein n=1 Tax=Prochlorococcus TaxID=1218 RepID=UPI0005337EC6|nr:MULTISPECIES: diacylglycerol kinase family protein [Prochlorococcus]KGG13189.1 Diacylglycerol kinase [Prochlorococcus sp. MIT 0601]
MTNPSNEDLAREKVTELTSHAKRPLRRDSWLIAKDLPASFQYAAQGIKYGFSSERNFRIHVAIACIVSFLSIWLELPVYNLAILVLTIASVLVLELLNTAIEAVVDLSIGRRFHPLARIAKDCSAAAVLIASISSVLVAVLLILPKLLDRLNF